MVVDRIVSSAIGDLRNPTARVAPGDFVPESGLVVTAAGPEDFVHSQTNRTVHSRVAMDIDAAVIGK